MKGEKENPLQWQSLSDELSPSTEQSDDEKFNGILEICNHKLKHFFNETILHPQLQMTALSLHASLREAY